MRVGSPHKHSQTCNAEMLSFRPSPFSLANQGKKRVLPILLGKGYSAEDARLFARRLVTDSSGRTATRRLEYTFQVQATANPSDLALMLLRRSVCTASTVLSANIH
jgi:hypothetical protein